MIRQAVSCCFSVAFVGIKELPGKPPPRRYFSDLCFQPSQSSVEGRVWDLYCSRAVGLQSHFRAGQLKISVLSVSRG